jgi:hypothetical protein
MAFISQEAIVTVSAKQRVVALAAKQKIVAIAAVEAVIARSAAERVIASAAQERGGRGHDTIRTPALNFHAIVAAQGIDKDAGDIGLVEEADLFVEVHSDLVIGSSANTDLVIPSGAGDGE